MAYEENSKGFGKGIDFFIVFSSIFNIYIIEYKEIPMFHLMTHHEHSLRLLIFIHGIL